MNKRQRKKAGLKPRPSRRERRLYSKRLAMAEYYIGNEIERGIASMTVQECIDQDLTKVQRLAQEALRNVMPFKDPWGDRLPVINITKQIPGTVHKVRLNFMVSM